MASGPGLVTRHRRWALVVVRTVTLPTGNPAASGWSALMMRMVLYMAAVLTTEPMPISVVLPSLLMITGTVVVLRSGAGWSSNIFALGPTMISAASGIIAAGVGLSAILTTMPCESFIEFRMSTSDLRDGSLALAPALASWR